MDAHNKHDRMSDVVNTSVTELAELARAASVPEAMFGSTLVPDEPQSLTCMSAVRHFQAAGATTHGLSPGAILGEHFYDRGGGEWEDFASAQSSPGACKFIKDEKESAVTISSPDLNPPDIAALDGDRKPLQRTGGAAGSGDGQSALSFALPDSQNFVGDIDQPDSRCAANFDTSRNPVQQLAAFKNEAPRWQSPAADSQFWCQVPAAVSDDPFSQSGYEGGQGQPVTQRNLSPSFAFQG